MSYGSSVSAAWNTRLYHMMFNLLGSRLFFAGRFEGFVDQSNSPTWGRTGNCLRRYGRPWLIPSSATTNRLCSSYGLSNGAQECYISSFSMEDPAKIRVQAELDLFLSDSTFRRTMHAFCGYRAWHMALPILLTISLDSGGSSTVFGKQRPETTYPCLSLRTVRLCFRNFEHGTLHASRTCCGYLERQAHC